MRCKNTSGLALARLLARSGVTVRLRREALGTLSRNLCTIVEHTLQPTPIPLLVVAVNLSGALHGMRLIHTSKLELDSFFGEEIPKYAILSHCWGKREVTLQNFEHDTKRIGQGWTKILNACRLAHAHGFHWIWIDTCCIDKTNSVELSEAINSMFRWYAQAQRCYAFLDNIYKHNADISTQRWFTRGWTLQELVAPAKLHFYDSNFVHLGSREWYAKTICDVTRVPESLLKHRDLLSNHAGLRTMLDECSVARRMSWAANRKTTRVEDTAHCLLGIFDVTMPLLYGEGQNAFARLQQQIISQSSDESIFAWTSQDNCENTVESVVPACDIESNSHEARNEPHVQRGIFAQSPAEFIHSGSIRPIVLRPQRPPFYITNRGLKLHYTPISVWRQLKALVCNISPEGSGTKFWSVNWLHLWAFGTQKIVLGLECETTESGHGIAIVLDRLMDGSYARTESPTLRYYHHR